MSQKIFIALLIIIWLYSGFPQIEFKTEYISFEFPPQIHTAFAATTTVTITATTTTSWTVPTDWNNSQNSVKVIGGGGGGWTTAAGGGGNGGGGGGAYAESNNLVLTPDDSITIQVGDMGAPSASGTDSWFNGSTCLLATACARAGGGATSATGALGGGAGGGDTSNYGTSTFAGGNGGTGNSAADTAGGGGGAGGPFGVGANGGNGDTSTGGDDGGGGGGGNGGGSTGSNGGTAGGAGGDSCGSACGGAAGDGGNGGVNGAGADGVTGGGGGGGDDGQLGGNGGPGVDINGSVGSGGGGGGAGNLVGSDWGGNGGLYGGGGGGGMSGAGSRSWGGAGVIIIEYQVPDPKPASLVQHAYTWFSNTNSAAVGGAAGSNQPTTAPKNGTPFRLRLLLYNEGGTSIGASGTTTDLQVALTDNDGVCDGNESYSDVASGSGAIQYYNNSTPADGNDLTANIFDPKATSSNVTVRTQDYEELNTFTNSVAAIAENEAGLWDFALVDAGSPPHTTYCFRAVQSGANEVLSGGYDVYPEITTAKPVLIRLRGDVRLRTVRLR